MTDIREAAIWAARAKLQAEASKAAEKRAKMMQREAGGRMVSYSLSDYCDGYAEGHAAGVADGARAFIKHLVEREEKYLMQSEGVWIDFSKFPWDRIEARFLASRPAPGTGLALFQDAPPDDDGGVPDPDMED